jgi:hypothetical protein
MTPYFIGLACFSAFFRSRYSLSLSFLALRQQVGALKRKLPHPRLQIRDRIFLILLRRLWPALSHVLVIVKPKTVVARHRAGFRLFRSLLRTLPAVLMMGVCTCRPSHLIEEHGDSSPPHLIVAPLCAPPS